jgi:PAS domain-containing protein
MEFATVGLFIGDAKQRERLAGFLRDASHVVADFCAAPPAASWIHPPVIVTDEPFAASLGDALIGSKQGMIPPHLALVVVVGEQAGAGPWLRAGFDDVVRQSVEKEEFLARVEACIRRRTHLEDSVREGESHFRALFDRAPVGIAQISPAGHCIRANSRLFEIMGRSM